MTRVFTALWDFRFKEKQMKKQLNGLFGTTVKLIAAMILISSCTKTRQAELPEDDQPNVFAISEIPQTSESTPYSAKMSNVQTESEENSMKALDLNTSQKLSLDDVQVPARLAFMFDNLPVSNRSSNQFKITFSLEKDYVTAYKVATAKDLTLLEKALAVSTEEVQLLTQKQKVESTKSTNLTALLKQAESKKLEIKNGKKEGTLLVPLFRYKIEDYGILQRTKNELKESTSVLALKKTNWQEATHIKITAKIDNRIVLGLQDSDKDLLDTLFLENKLDNRVMNAEELQSQLKFGMKFVDGKTQVFTKLDESVMHIYEVTTLDKLNEQQKRLIKFQSGNQEVISCSDTQVSSFINSEDKDCVLLLKADLPINYVQTKVEINQTNGANSLKFKTQNAPRAQSAGLVQILENTAAKQVDISGTLDPDSTVRLTDLKGEFFYRRTFENASNIFLGRTGTSGDMTIVRFELEDDRIVVRNQQSLITYTGQGPKDREELMSFPVKYIRMNKISANGSVLSIPVAETTTKEKAEYAVIDWTKNTVPDSNSPLAFYSGGDCIYATSSQRVTDTDMRLANDGVLNFSIAGSYTVKPQVGCFAIKEVNAAYWGGTYQFNFNLSERISFLRHSDPKADIQFAQNISSMAQEAFNFGVFTLADKVKQNGTLDNRDGSEKYMPIIHDFRNGRKLKYYVGGLNNADATNPERRQLMVEATHQVIEEWNKTLRYAFKGTSLERAGDYVEIEIDDANSTGHLGDLDRNYIWYQELEAENGLLGVAQPAANPRSGTIQSANVIIYSGNTFDQTERLIAMTSISRKYEKMIEDIKKQAIEEAKKAKDVVETKDKIEEAAVAANVKTGKVDGNQVERIKAKAQRLNKTLLQSIQALQIDHQNIKDMIKDIRMNKSVSANQRKLTRELLRTQIKGQTIEYPANESTFLKKITDLTVNKKLSQSPHKLELALNDAFIRYGQIDEEVKAALKTRSEMLGAIIKFDESMKDRPGCYLYARNDINDEALALDKDPHKNLLLNFKKNIMSTLSHELGHAFGLLHNFKASTDLANYEFPGESTGRNYSSIMDYIADIDMKYAGPGPYDAHAIRAAYTGMVELSDTARKDEKITKALAASADGLVGINNVVKALGQKSTVHFTKETLNKSGIMKYFEQCSDGGMDTSSMCAQFDSGGSATDIVNNLIADYTRGYVGRNYVYDKISFGWPQKIQIIQRNISLFQNIRRFLDEAVMNAIYSPGRTEQENQVVLNDLVKAAKKGYMFFHELLRTPDASGVKLTNFNKRFMAIPYKYEKAEVDAQGKETGKTVEVEDIKVLEARSLYDVAMTRDKIDTIGIGYDKLFAMQFLMQSSAAQATDDSQVSMISYVDFEQFFMGITDPAESLTLNTILEILSDDLKAGFFAPTETLEDLPLISVSSSAVDINRSLGDQTAVAAVVGLAESKWRGFDPFAETFKVSRSSVKNAPKDRFSVAKLGQDRSLSDTRVYFASQNALAANALIKASARNETFLDNKAELFQSMKDIYLADLEWRKPISDVVAKACEANDEGAPKDAAACETAKAKSIEDHIKEMPQLAVLKSKADGVAKKLGGILRRMNQKELIMAKELDAADSASNFTRQVEVVRSTLSSQISLITEVLTILQTTKPEALEQTIQAISQALKQSRAQNDKLALVPLIAMAHNFITEISANLKVELQGGNGTVTGTTIAEILMEKDKLKEQNDKQLEVIEKLSTYTGLVDPDTILQ